MLSKLAKNGWITWINSPDRKLHANLEVSNESWRAKTRRGEDLTVPRSHRGRHVLLEPFTTIHNCISWPGTLDWCSLSYLYIPLLNIPFTNKQVFVSRRNLTGRGCTDLGIDNSATLRDRFGDPVLRTAGRSAGEVVCGHAQPAR